MAKLNQKSVGSLKRSYGTPNTTNHEGGEAYTLDAEEKLFNMVSSRLVGESTYYVDAPALDGEIVRLIHEIAENGDPLYPLQLAAYTRNVLNLRTISILMLVECSTIEACRPFVREFTPVIVRRADELKEVLAYLNTKIGHIGNGGREGRRNDGHASMPMALKKGLADTFHNFNEYQLQKYNGGNGKVKLKDVLRLVHPKPKNTQESTMWHALLNDGLATPETWETTIPNWKTLGYSSKKEAWESIIPKMGYMALLRNLRNFLEEGVNVDGVIEKLTNEEQVRKSKQIPFRFLSAYSNVALGNAVNAADKAAVLNAIEEAMEVSIDNYADIPGITFSSSDNSGSMSGVISAKSTVARSAISNTLQSILYAKSKKAIASVFGTYFHVINLSKRGIMQNIKTAQNTFTDSNTYTYLTVQYLNQTKTFVDRIVIITDEEAYGGSLTEEIAKYRRNVNPKVFVYVINVAGYGTSSVNTNDKRTLVFNGWSDKFIEYIPIFEADRGTVIEEIKNLEPTSELINRNYGGKKEAWTGRRRKKEAEDWTGAPRPKKDEEEDDEQW